MVMGTNSSDTQECSFHLLTPEAFAKPQRFNRNIALEHPWCII